MINKPKGYDDAQTYSENRKLPAGGYVIEIKKAEVGSYDNGNQYLQIAFDICEGEFKDFYVDQYNNSTFEPKQYKGRIRLGLPKEDGTEQDNWTLRNLKTNMVAIEESNNDYTWDWDETKLKGLKAGMLFRNKEYSYNGNNGFWTEPFKFFNIDKIREGKFEIPKDKLLSNSSEPTNIPKGFEAIDDDEIPF